MELGPVGIWSIPLRYGDPGQAAEAAAELDELGYAAVWIPDIGGDIFGSVANLLGATRKMTVATGILNLWMHTAAEVAEGYSRLSSDGRFLLGLGVSHGPLIDRVIEPGRYTKPLSAMAGYLDELDKADPPVPAGARVLAALGPKMLELSRDRAGGAHPYLTTAEHTAQARAVLGPGPLLLPEQRVVLESDPGKARAAGRAHLATYLGLPNYANNLLRSGFSEADLADGGSDHLVDSLVAWGDEAVITRRVREHLDAGADHVCVQVLTGDRETIPRDAWRRLAPALL